MNRWDQVQEWYLETHYFMERLVANKITGSQHLDWMSERRIYAIVPLKYSRLAKHQHLDYFWISDALTKIVKYAADSLPEDIVFRSSDLQSMAGFMVFESPFEIGVLNRDGYLPVSSILWSGDSDGSGFGLATFSDRDDLREFENDSDAELWHRNALLSGVSKFIPDGAGMVPFSEQPLGVVPLDELRDRLASMVGTRFEKPLSAMTQQDLKSAETMMRFFYALQIFIAQKIASRMQINQSRVVRRRLQKEYSEESTLINVIDLRRYHNGVGEEHGSGKEFHCRWLVSGHWRQQWYPSESRHKPKWILPYVKGPENKPLIIKDRLFRIIR